ncbi:14710_t:CDS:2 [Entrophospora sp. SA101]|nr:14710_t:CDS:2 [Entrophospora sp. SA101]
MVHKVIVDVDKGQPLLIEEVPILDSDTLNDLESQLGKTLNGLLVELDVIEKSGNEIFSKIENSFSYPYPTSSATEELNTLLQSIKLFENKAKSKGITSLTNNIEEPDNISDNINNRIRAMTEERSKATDALFQEIKKISNNANAVLS